MDLRGAARFRLTSLQFVCLSLCLMKGIYAQNPSAPQQPRSPRLARLSADLATGSQHALSEFWSEMEKSGTPLIEPIPGDAKHFLTTFLWHATKPVTNVLLISGLTNSSYGRDDLSQNLLSRLPHSDLWYLTRRVRGDARFTYTLSIDDSLVPAEDERNPEGRQERFRPDPLNSHHATAADQESDSLAELPLAPPQQWFRRTNVAKGEIAEVAFKSAILGNERKIWIYKPAGYVSSHAPYHLLILFDGEAYIKGLQSAAILDNLIAAGRIHPTVAVFIGNLPADQPKARTTELSCYDPFTKFLADELLPWLHARYDLTSRPAETVVGGVSRGGTAAACAALQHPELFGNVSSQSGFFVYKDRNWFKNADPADAPDAESQDEMAWEEYGQLMQKFAAAPRLRLRFYIDVGKFENNFHPSPLTANRHLRDVLIAKGYDVKYQEFAGHHSYVNWRGTFPDALIYLLGKPGTH